jgi:hypothetical protein
LNIGTEPNVSGRRAGENLRESPKKDRNFGSFLDRERQELKDGCPSGHGFGDSLHQRSLLGSREDPLPFFPGRAVNPGSHIIQDLGHILNFIEDDRGADFGHKRMSVRAQAGDDIGILEKIIGGPGEKSPQKSRLPRAPRTRQDQGAEVSGSPKKLGFNQAGDETHNEYFKPEL